MQEVRRLVKARYLEKVQIILVKQSLNRYSLLSLVGGL